jgi:HD-GYP domain-containing protein (c-di-GMP phosphodiesterase class II)
MFGKLKNRWLLVVLVSGLQLTASLLLVNWGFDWFKDRAVESLCKEALLANDKLGSYLINLDGKSTDGLTLVEKVEFRPFDGKNVWVIDALSGTVLVRPGGLQSYNDTSISKEPFVPISSLDHSPDSLQQRFLDQELQSTSGTVNLNGTPFLLVAHRLPRKSTVVLVGQPVVDVVGSFLAWFDPAKKVGFGVTLILGFATILASMSILQRFDFQVHGMYRMLSHRLHEQKTEIAKTQNGVIFGLAKLAESRDNDTGDHLDRIRKYVTILAQDLSEFLPEVDQEFVTNLGLASTLHDIGKVGIPDAILLKPGHLTDQERQIMEVHTKIGGECLDAIQQQMGADPFLEMARQIALSHHERWDGHGYPDGKSKTAIPLEARIVAVADVYDALTSRRPYKRAMLHSESMEVIVNGGGTQFDPQIVAAFQRQESKFLEILEQTHAGISSEEDTVPAICRLQMSLSTVEWESAGLIPNSVCHKT